MTRKLTLGFSPCPNDTFIFYPLVHGLVDTGGISFTERLEDVETLNRLAIGGTLDITKLSYNALGHVREEYALLRSGSALGRGCGPLVVAREHHGQDWLTGKTIAIPGSHTTAFLLLRLFNPDLENFIVMPFHEIMESVARGDVDAGVIIHESRFTFEGFGLRRIIDLGEWWEGETSLPIPLGGIAARRTLGTETINLIDDALRTGVEYSRRHPEKAAGYIREHAREMSLEVCSSHISLYVNDFSLELGAEGESAITELFTRGTAAGIIPGFSGSLFA